MTVHELSEKTGFETVCNTDNRDVTAVFCCDMLSIAMSRAPENGAWVTVIGNANVVAVATLTDVSCIIIAEGYDFDEAAIAAAQGKVQLMKSPLPSYETAVKIGNLL